MRQLAQRSGLENRLVVCTRARVTTSFPAVLQQVRDMIKDCDSGLKKRRVGLKAAMQEGRRVS